MGESIINITELSSFDDGKWFEINMFENVSHGIIQFENIEINSIEVFENIDTSISLENDSVVVFFQNSMNRVDHMSFNTVNFSVLLPLTENYFLIWTNYKYEKVCISENTTLFTETYTYSPSQSICSTNTGLQQQQPSPPPPEIPPPFYPPFYPPSFPPPPYSFIHQDPHLKFANGAVADFRGLNNTIFNILSYQNLSFSMKTMDVSFLLPKPMKVDGSFFTEAFLLIREDSREFLLSIDASRSGFEYFDLSTSKKYRNYIDFKFKKLRFTTKRKLYEMSTPEWEITVARKPVYNSLTENIRWRLDVRIKLLKQYGIENVHGIIGQTFQKNKSYKVGKTDNYTGKIYVKTSAQAEGIIDGIYTDYIIKNVLTHDYKYSMFETKCESGDIKNDKFYASSDDITNR